MKTIAFYISGHGFGHASRSAEVIRVLLSRRPDLKIIVKSSAPDWFFRERITTEFEYFNNEFDTGVSQDDSLTLDSLLTLKNYADFQRRAEELLFCELDSFLPDPPGLILGDIPPLAFRIAQKAGIPSLALANFSWDWIYEPYVEKRPAYRHLIETIRDDYGRADLLLRLPFSAPMAAFSRAMDIPLIARSSAFSREEARRRLGLPLERPVILLSFGGFGLGDEYYRRLAANREFCWIASERVGIDVEGIMNFRRQDLARLGLGYPDLVRAADAVITKPGYGILSECVANRTRMLYTSRGDFREYHILVREAEKHLPCRFISPDKLKSGQVADDLKALLALPDAFPALALNGAETCAEVILETIGLK